MRWIENSSRERKEKKALVIFLKNERPYFGVDTQYQLLSAPTSFLTIFVLAVLV